MNKRISPHVQIYKFPITAISSITNRVTGLALTGYYLGFGMLCFYPKKDELFKKYENLDWKYKKLINYSLIFPTSYHTIGGLRHFIWDKYPHLLKNNAVQKSSIFLFGGSLLMSIISENILFEKDKKL